MSVNLELNCIAADHYLDKDNVLCYRKRAELTKAETIALQEYGSTNRKIGFMNKGTYDLHKEAKVCKWYDCFTTGELEDIKKYLRSHGHDEVLKEFS